MQAAWNNLESIEKTKKTPRTNIPQSVCKSYYPIYMKTIGYSSTIFRLQSWQIKYKSNHKPFLKRINNSLRGKTKFKLWKIYGTWNSWFKFIDTLKFLAPNMNLEKWFKSSGCAQQKLVVTDELLNSCHYLPTPGPVH